MRDLDLWVVPALIRRKLSITRIINYITSNSICKQILCELHLISFFLAVLLKMVLLKILIIISIHF